MLSHLHHDHADGLEHFKGTEIVVSEENYQASKGLHGAIFGAIPSRWPSWFDPTRRAFDGPAVGGFPASIPLTADGTVFAVPTPGHMPGHVSVVVRDKDVTYFLAGDATYDQDLLQQRIIDGASGDVGASLKTTERILAFASTEPTVLLPAHDPAAEQRLEERRLLTPVPAGQLRQQRSAQGRPRRGGVSCVETRSLPTTGLFFYWHVLKPSVLRT